MSKKNKTLFIIGGLALLILTFFLAADYLSWKNYYYNRIGPGVYVGSFDLGGHTLAEAEQIIKTQTQDIENKGLSFRYKNQVENLPSAVSSFDSDLAYQSFSFDAIATAQAAFGTGVRRSFWYYLLSSFHLVKPEVIDAVYSLDQEKTQQFLAATFSDLNIAPADAYFSLTGDAKTGQLQTNPSQIGKEIDYQNAFSQLAANLSLLQNNPIILQTRSKYPAIRQADLAGLEERARQIINRGGLTLQVTASSTKIWEINPQEIITWAVTQSNNKQAVLILSPDKIQAYLSEHISPAIDQAPVIPRFTVVNGRVANWQVGQNGLALDLPASAKEISTDFMAGQNKIDLITKIVPADSGVEANNLNIKEIIGTGSSNFTGSPANRLHNIAVGAAALQGLLIKPGEEFSLVKALGDISAKTGYLEELVIKDNKTLPEYGGGLCQIGTTMFRTALAAGLPITMRQNHSYRVSYYEPAGTDATIYDPLPDLRFINDTGNYILIQSRTVKNTLYFDFWGTSDGRIATTTTPVIYNYVKPEPTKYIITNTLKPGQKKCTETSHYGVDAYFDYTVIYPADSTTTSVHERRFNSHYLPWQAVCLIGATATSSPSASSSSSIIYDNQKAAGVPAATSSKIKP